MNAPLALPALDEIRAHEAEMVEIRNDRVLGTGASCWVRLAEAWSNAA